MYFHPFALEAAERHYGRDVSKEPAGYHRACRRVRGRPRRIETNRVSETASSSVAWHAGERGRSQRCLVDPRVG